MSVHASDAPADGHVSTGRLPREEIVRRLLVESYERYRSVDDGVVADYIPALARVAPDLFGACIVSADGRTVAAGDATYRFSIQSVSKPFVFALVCDAIGHEEARRKLGVNSTGLPFNSVMAIELNADRTMNPMVNAGAIATTSLVPGPTAEDKWRNIQDGLSRFAGRRLELDREVYESEAATNRRNQGIAHLLDSYGRLYFDPDEAADVYTPVLADGVRRGPGGDGRDARRRRRQPAYWCAGHRLGDLQTSARRDGHGRPVRAVRGVDVDIGLPGKSGVSGGIVTVSPGKGGLGTFSPRLDSAGNSVRGMLLTKHLSERLGLNIYTSVPAVTPR